MLHFDVASVRGVITNTKRQAVSEKFEKSKNFAPLTEKQFRNFATVKKVNTINPTCRSWLPK